MKEKKIKGFTKAALIYGAVLAGIILLALGTLALFLNDYENTRPDTVAARYVQNLDSESVHGFAEGAVSTLNFSLMPEEDCYAFIENAVHSADTVKLRDKSSSAITYLVRCGDSQVGKLTLESTGGSLFGFDKLAVSQAEFDFMPLRGEERVSIPADWRAECPGELIVEDREQPYELLNEFYGGDVPVPYLISYSTGGYLVRPELKLISPDGAEFDAVSEELFIDNCPETERQNLKDFSEEFLRRYIKYASNMDGNTSGNYFRLADIMVEGSTLQKRMRYAVSGLNYGGSLGDDLQDLVYNHLMELGGGYYLADFSYEMNTVGHKGAVTTENNMKLIMLKTQEGGFLAAACSSY